ncbi:MAG TPA: hypothetical protein VIV40_00465 [Kofleriaceae bacterium]
MRVVPLVVSALGCAGCDSVWDLEHVEAPTPTRCAAPIGHDEDLDGLDDACDPCPFDVDNAGDADGDGIADGCDPDPDQVDDVVMFSGFEVASRGELTIVDGSYDADSFRATGTGAAALLWNGAPDATWIVAGIDVDSLEATSYREVGLVLDAALTSSSQVNGTICVLGRDYFDRDYAEVYTRNRPLSDIGVSHSDVSQPLAGFHGVVRASYDRAAIPAVSCTFATTQQEVTITGTPQVMPPAGKLALYVLDTNAAFRFLFVVRRR